MGSFFCYNNTYVKDVIKRSCKRGEKVKDLLLEFFCSVKKARLLLGFVDSGDEKEKEHREFIDSRRRETNLRRSILLSVLFLFMIFLFFVIPTINTQLSGRDFVVMGAFAVFLLAYIAVAQRYHRIFSTADTHTEKSKVIVSVLFVVFWIFYYVVAILASMTFDNPVENTIVWLLLMVVGLSIPIISWAEAIFIYPFSIATIVIFSIVTKVDQTIVITCTPMVALFFIIIQFNHAERLEAFYEISKSIEESRENKRRLGNIFSRVYDMALEINMTTNKIEVLKGEKFYGITSSSKMTLEDLKNRIDNYIYEDDIQVFMRNFNSNYISEEIRSGKNQIYFEGRVLTSNEDYRWISVLLTKESSEKDDAYLLCLVQSINERKQNEDKLRLEAEKDPLTQLYNKMTTRSLIEECLEKNFSSQHALIIIDIDNFKTINDTRGHAVGDQILLAFANELNKNFRETDILGRAGGDEFIVLIKNVQSIAMVCDKLQHLTASFKKYGIDHGFPGRLSTSIGVAMFNKDGRTYEELFKKADAALYEAKRNGKDQYKFSISRT